MNTCKLPDCFPTSIESFESLPAELTNNCEYTLYGCQANKKEKEKEVLDEKFALISKEYNFLPLQHKKIGGCAGTQYGCDANGNTRGQPIQTESVKAPIVGGCAGTRYGCNSKKNPFIQPELEAKQVDILIGKPNLKGGCAGTQYGCDANGNTRGSPIQTESVKAPIVGGCAGTRYGCDATKKPPTQTEIVSKSVDKLIEPSRLIGGCAGTRYGCDANGNAKETPTQTEIIKVPEQNRITSESKPVKSESKKIVISEKINKESDEYNIIHIGIGVIIVTFILYFLFKK